MKKVKLSHLYTNRIIRLAAFSLVLLMSMYSCKTSTTGDDSASDVLSNDNISGLSGPIQLNIGSTILHLSDYFDDVSKVDSVTLPASGLSAKMNEDASVVIVASTEAPALAGLSAWINGKAATLLLKKSKLRPYTFSYDTKGKNYKTVQMKGEMNAWNVNAQELKEKDGVYSAQLQLEPKKYQYIMVLDGKEALDQNNTESVSNGFGGFNSVLNPFGGNEQEALVLYTTTYGDGTISLKTSRQVEDVIALWENVQIPVVIDEQSVSIALPKAANKIKRSHLRVFAFSGDMLSNDVLVPLENGNAVGSVKQLDRMDKHAMVLYNVFVDRFHNGDESNDRPLNIPEVHPRADDHGGDIKGATQKIKDGYFKDLGINTIWISPIVKNVEGAWGKWPDPETKFSAYHGYWPVSFTSIDDRKGTPEDLHELVKTAHDNNMNVLSDFVANHVHEDHPYYKADPKVATDLYLPDGRLNTELWDEQRLTTWFDVFLPSLRLDDPAVIKTVTDSAVYWIKEYNLDGFRHDATKHVPEIFWRTLTRKIKDEIIIPQGREVYQIGETYGTRELISSYINAGQLDAQFDFGLYDAIVAALAQDAGSFKDFDAALGQSLNVYGHHHLMGNITGNQDRGRFISYAGGALRFDMDSKLQGWTMDIGVGDPVAYRKSNMLFGMIATIPGLPVVYNGDEIGSYGGNDPDNRKMMRFDDLSENEEDLKKSIQGLMKFRQTSMPLLYGDIRIHHKENATYVFSRNYFDEHVLVAFNNSDSLQELEVALDDDQLSGTIVSNFGSKVSVVGSNIMKIELQPYSFEIITLN